MFFSYAQSFWFLSEGKFVHPLTNFAAPKVEVNKMFEIQPDELSIQSEITGEFINVPLPKSHTGDGPIFCRLISAKRRQGMVCIISKFHQFVSELLNVHLDASQARFKIFPAL